MNKLLITVMSLLLLVVIVTGGVIYAYQIRMMKFPPSLNYEMQEFSYQKLYLPPSDGWIIIFYQNMDTMPSFCN